MADPRHSPLAAGRLEHALRDGGFPVVTEINPVKPENLRYFFQRAELLTQFARAVTVNSLAGRDDQVGALDAAAALVARGVEAVPVITCRHADLDGLEARLAAAWTGGVRAVCCVRGDAPPGTDRRAAFGSSVLELIRRAAALEFPDGGRLFVGAGADVTKPREEALRLSLRKVEAGARFLMSQPAEPTEPHLDFVRALKDRAPDVRILWGLMYVGSVDELAAIEGRLGIRMPERTWRRLEGAADPAEEGLRILAEDTARLREAPEVDGVDVLFFRRHREMLGRITEVMNGG
ncbi:MAG TPA: methylenetetrahydrofolate reductase [Dehalococcoidia bacterium]